MKSVSYKYDVWKTAPFSRFTEIPNFIIKKKFGFVLYQTIIN